MINSPKNFNVGGKNFETVHDYFHDLAYQRGFEKYIPLFKEDFITSDDHQLHLDILSQSPTAHTIIIVPGTAIYGFCYAGIMIKLYEAGFNVIAPDLRGHGRSTGIRGDYTIEELVTDVQHIITYASKHFNKHISLLGSSQGAIVSLYTASKDKRIESMVCQNIADLSAPETVQLTRHQNLYKILRPLIIKAGELMPNTQVPITSYLNLESIKLSYYGNLKNFIAQDPLVLKSISLRALKSLSTAKMHKPIEYIDIPTMVISGKEDTIFPIAYTQSIFDKLQCQKEFKIYDNCDHALIHENVDLIHEDISNWFLKNSSIYST
jgi:alpha-beta hydrolase superfamily lysophospholipase